MQFGGIRKLLLTTPAPGVASASLKPLQRIVRPDHRPERLAVTVKKERRRTAMPAFVSAGDEVAEVEALSDPVD